MDLARARPARIKNTECCDSTVFLWVQYINDNNNWKQNIIFSQFNKHKQSRCTLQSIDKKKWCLEDTSGADQIKQCAMLCWALPFVTECSHHKLMPRKPFCSVHYCGLSMSHDFLKREGLILSSLEPVLCGSNCSDLNEVAPCN